MTPRKAGRPLLPSGQGRTEIITIRVRPDEREAIQDAAQKAGKSESEWIRDRLLTSKDV